MKKFVISLLIYFLQIPFVNCHPHQQVRYQKDKIEYSSRKSAPAIFQEFARAIQDSIAKNDIPGLSIAVVDRDSMLWAEAFGVLCKQSSDSVTTETIFSLQSISKAVTEKK